jgi:hypothetical protein
MQLCDPRANFQRTTLNLDNFVIHRDSSGNWTYPTFSGEELVETFPEFEEILVSVSQTRNLN